MLSFISVSLSAQAQSTLILNRSCFNFVYLGATYLSEVIVTKNSITQNNMTLVGKPMGTYFG